MDWPVRVAIVLQIRGAGQRDHCVVEMGCCSGCLLCCRNEGLVGVTVVLLIWGDSQLPLSQAALVLYTLFYLNLIKKPDVL